jgi:zinc transport system substrate-binding protein
VAAVNYPLAYFAGRIGGDLVDVVFPVPGDVDPAFWNPSSGDVAVFQAADLILLNGATYTKWVPKVTLSASKMLDTSASFADRYITIEGAATHAHGPGGEHAHTGTAFTTWLDFTQAAAQAEAIRAAFTARRPQHAASFAANFAALEKDLLDIDGQLTAMTAEKGNRPIVASHPVYQYLARRHDLNLESVMWEPEVVPQGSLWRELADGLEAHPAAWMIWEGEPAAESVRRLEDMGVHSLVFEPCMNKPETGDFMSVMRANIKALGVAYQ